MRRTIRKSLILLGAVAAIAIALPSSARAATSTAISPNITAASCANGPSPKDFTLEDVSSGFVGEIDSSTGDLYIGGGTAHDFCQAYVNVSLGIVEIFTSSTSYCLAYSAPTVNNAYQHAPASNGCTASTPPVWMQWKFISQGVVGGQEAYLLQTED